MEWKKRHDSPKLKLRKEERALNGHDVTQCPFSDLLRETCQPF